jgi:MFS family permease
MVFCGMLLSSSIWGKISDKYGRRVCLFLCTAFTFVFGFASSFSPSFIWILVFRALGGFGIGGAPQAVTLLGEFLPLKQRARCLVFSVTYWSMLRGLFSNFYNVTWMEMVFRRVFNALLIFLLLCF